MATGNLSRKKSQRKRGAGGERGGGEGKKEEKEAQRVQVDDAAVLNQLRKSAQTARAMRGFPGMSIICVSLIKCI